MILQEGKKLLEQKLLEKDSYREQHLMIEFTNNSALYNIYIRAETDGKFYYPDILSTIFPDILRIVTSLFAIEALYFYL